MAPWVQRDLSKFWGSLFSHEWVSDSYMVQYLYDDGLQQEDTAFLFSRALHYHGADYAKNLFGGTAGIETKRTVVSGWVLKYEMSWSDAFEFNAFSVKGVLRNTDIQKVQFIDSSGATQGIMYTIYPH